MVASYYHHEIQASPYKLACMIDAAENSVGNVLAVTYQDVTNLCENTSKGATFHY